MFLNSNEIENAARVATREDNNMPNATKAAMILYRLMRWTNENSDGWPYWAKPSNASQKLQRIVGDRFKIYGRSPENEDITDTELRSALSPVKAFLTRQNIDHNLILN